MAVKLVKIERTVIVSGGQPKPILDKSIFPRPIARIHSVDLRQRHMGLVHKQQKILREII